MEDVGLTMSEGIDMQINRVCIVGASGKLGQYMVQHALDRGFFVEKCET
jgi:nucleoside-diphosphate-sugar epimerase